MCISFWREDVVRSYQGDAGILAYDIPLHLKILDLIESIGNFCVGFLVVDWNAWSSLFVRIKVRAVGLIPREVPLRFGNSYYVVRISKPPAAEAELSPAGGSRVSICGNDKSRLDSMEHTSSTSSSMKPHSCRNGVSKTARSRRGVADNHRGISNSQNLHLQPKKNERKVWFRKLGPVLNPSLAAHYVGNSGTSLDLGSPLHHLKPNPRAIFAKLIMDPTWFLPPLRPGPFLSSLVSKLLVACTSWALTSSSLPKSLQRYRYTPFSSPIDFEDLPECEPVNSPPSESPDWSYSPSSLSNPA
ncbi:unnamed protein product [Linum trigynum]|uniref:Uncharacterized protein n=1 Tax=Linum trigynum TaxID=586398 RepID=A0AAV2E7A8_9ROSI